MVWIVKNIEEADAYWNKDTGWGDVAIATVFSNMDKMSVQLPAGGAWMRPSRKRSPIHYNTTDVHFYNIVERFIATHPGNDNPSKELENLCGKLRAADPQLCAELAGNERQLKASLEFAYQLLKLQ